MCNVHSPNALQIEEEELNTFFQPSSQTLNMSIRDLHRIFDRVVLLTQAGRNTTYQVWHDARPEIKFTGTCRQILRDFEQEIAQVNGPPTANHTDDRMLID